MPAYRNSAAVVASARWNPVAAQSRSRPIHRSGAASSTSRRWCWSAAASPTAATTWLPSTWRLRSAGRTTTASSAARAMRRSATSSAPASTRSASRRPEQIVQTSMAAGGREADSSKPTLAALQTRPATKVDGVLVRRLPAVARMRAGADHRRLRRELTDRRADRRRRGRRARTARIRSGRRRHDLRAAAARLPEPGALRLGVGQPRIPLSRRLQAVGGVDEVDATAILGWLQDRQDAMTALLERLASAESPSLDADAQREPFAILAGELESLGFAGRADRGKVGRRPPRGATDRRGRRALPAAARPHGHGLAARDDRARCRFESSRTGWPAPASTT